MIEGSTLFADKAAIKMLLNEVHPRRAFVALIKGDADQFEAPIGDASCQIRTPVVNEAAAVFHAQLKSSVKKDELMAAISAYEKQFSSIPGDGRVKNEIDIKDRGKGPDDFEAFYAEFTGLLEPEIWRLLVAFYSKTVDCTRSFIFNGAPLARRDHAVYHASTVEAEKSKKRRDREDLDSPLKARIGGENVEFLTRRLQNTMRFSNSFEQELIEAITATQALIKLADGNHYHVGQTYASFAAVFYLEYQAFRPIVVSVCRMKIDNGCSWEFCEILLWTPNNAGSWTYVPNPPEEHHRRVCAYFNMFSTVTPETKGRGLSSPNLSEFMIALKSADLPWIVQRYAAVHPSYTGKADRIQFPEEAHLIENAATIAQACTFDDAHCEGFSFNPHMPGQFRLGLSTQWACAYMAGLNIKDGREYAEIPGQGEIRTYTKDSISVAVNHVQSGSFDAVQVEMKRLWTRYEKAGRPTLGHFIVRYGSQGVHFESLAEAIKFSTPRTNQQRKFLVDNRLVTLYEK